MEIIILVKQRKFIILMVSLLILGFFLPVLLQQNPAGTDIYSHMFHTELLYNSNSLHEFYETCLGNSYVGFDYPFGLWLYGSVVAKITGLDLHTVSYLLPLLLVLVIISMYYVYSSTFIKESKYKLLSIMFFLSMPIISMSILYYQTSIFSIPLLLFILYLVFNKNISTRVFVILLPLFVFIQCFTHTGTYMFLMFFSITYAFLHGILQNHVDRKAYFLLVSVLFVYGITTTIFPYIHPQYIDKTRLILIVGEFFKDKTGLNFVDDLVRLVYERVFVEKNFFDIALWSGFIFALIELMIFTTGHLIKILSEFYRKNKSFYKKNKPVYIPLLGEVRHISHSIIATPFWIGPIHSILSLIAFFKIDKDLWTIFLSILLVTVIPGSQVTSYTGALKEIIYLFLVFPITSTIGFMIIEKRLAEFIERGIREKLSFIILLGIFTTFLISPIVGNYYYKPSISGSDIERTGLKWLAEIGEPTEGCNDIGYGHRVTFYGKKEAPLASLVNQGSETRYFFSTIKNIYSVDRSEEDIRDLFSKFKVRYYILSNRILSAFDLESENVRLGDNNELDKIISIGEDFELYKYSIPEDRIVHNSIVEKINFDERYPQIEDVGADFLIETKEYKIVIDKLRPKIKYLGNNKRNYLGEGSISDKLRISWYGKIYQDRSKAYGFNNLNFSVSIKDNQLTYEKILIGDDENERWATLRVRYTFYEDAVKNEIIVANDWLSPSQLMDLYVETTTFIPYTSFIFENWYGIEKTKKIYPSEDPSKMEGEKIKSILFSNEGEGIYIKHDKSSPYPQNIVYKGSTIYDYSVINLNNQYFVNTGDKLHFTRYLSVGDENTSKENVEKYFSVVLSSFPKGITPIALTSHLDKSKNVMEEKLEHIINAYRGLDDYNLTTIFNEGFDFSDPNINETNNLIQVLKNYDIGLTAYSSLVEDQYDSSLIQKERIDNITKKAKEYDIQLKGVITEDLKYNLGTIEALVDSNMSYIEGISIGSPFMEFGQEGLRHLRFAQYHGEETPIVLLPVSGPPSYRLIHGYSMDELISSWKKAIDSVLVQDDVCILLIKSSDMGDKMYLDKVLGLLDYANEKELSFISLERISNHFRLLRNISLKVSKKIDETSIMFMNNNKNKVEGVTVIVMMPSIENQCPYTSDNGKIEKIRRNGNECKCYVSTDLEAMSNKTVLVKPTIERLNFEIDIPDTTIEGEILISVKDENNNPVENVQLEVVNNLIVETDSEGIATLDLRRGNYVIEVRKPGYNTRIFNLEVKGRIYHILSIFNRG